MKHTLSILALGLCLLAGAPATALAQTHNTTSQLQTTCEVEVKPFSKLQVHGCLDVVFTPTQASQAPRLCFAKQDEGRLRIEVTDHTLVLDFSQGSPRTKRTKLRNRRIEVRVAAPMVKSVNIHGAGNVQFASDIRTAQLDWKVNGMGKIGAQKVDCNDFRVTLNGNGLITLEQLNAPQVETTINGCGSLQLNRVEATNLQAKVMGNGQMDLEQIKAAKAELTIHGTGLLTATDIEAGESRNTVNGNGSLRVKRLAANRVENELGGAGLIRMEQVKAALLNTQLHSNGDLKLLGLDVQKVDVTVSGGGEAELKGKAGDAQLTVGGNGSIEAAALLTQNTEATALSHGGTIKCQATNQLIINEFRNIRSVKVKGKPQQIKRNLQDG